MHFASRVIFICLSKNLGAKQLLNVLGPWQSLKYYDIFKLFGNWTKYKKLEVVWPMEIIDINFY